MSELDNDELIATRKLNGLEDNLYKKINIEDNIKRCKKLTEPQNANWIGISNQKAIAGVLARIKELEEEKKNKADFVQKYIEVTNLYLNSIPKQKVKETVQEVIELIESEQFKIILGDMTKVGRIKYLLEKLLEEK